MFRWILFYELPKRWEAKSAILFAIFRVCSRGPATQSREAQVISQPPSLAEPAQLFCAELHE